MTIEIDNADDDHEPFYETLDKTLNDSNQSITIISDDDDDTDKNKLVDKSLLATIKKEIIKKKFDDDEIYSLDEESDHQTQDSDLIVKPNRPKKLDRLLSDSEAEKTIDFDKDLPPNTRITRSSTAKPDKLSSSSSKKPLKRVRVDDSDQSTESEADNSEYDDTDEDEEDVMDDEDDESMPKRRRKKLRKIIPESKQQPETKQAQAEERERIKRLEKLVEAEREYYRHLLQPAEKQIAENVPQCEPFYLDIDVKTKKPLLKMHDSITAKLKPHQVDGVKFMWKNCFESVEAIENGNRGSGCVLAHCMGLGKTLQVVSLVHTLMANRSQTNVNRVIVFTPINALLNWRTEFDKWLDKCDYKPMVFDLCGITSVEDRIKIAKKWFDNGGVFLMGYNLFKSLVDLKKTKKTPTKAQQEKKMKHVELFERYFVNPGADLVICDEGHILKNIKTDTSTHLNRIKTRRRVVLTGTPLQNNLVEYWCMVNFVKPNLLGSLKEFRNSFVNPIEEGQHSDSTWHEVNYMKKRVHVLYQKLENCVQRRNFEVVRQYLPPKTEYTISIRMSDKQIELYNGYLTGKGYQTDEGIDKVKGAQLFTDYSVFYRIWSHPFLLTKNLRDDFDDGGFINDDDEDDYDSDDSTRRAKKRKSTSTATGHSTSKKRKNGTIDLDLPPELDVNWWREFVSEDCEYDPTFSGKIMLLIEVIKQCEKSGEKLLIFSKSLYSLDFIERFLKFWSMYPEKFGSKKIRWREQTDYYRMDGQTKAPDRKLYIDDFNDPDNYRGRLFLISTRAGGIGVNLVAANRAIIFDSSWNPADDIQAIFRIYRFGQEKQVFIYRFVSQGTMEEKIYQRQVTKQSLSIRVVDQNQQARHYTKQQLRELYSFTPDVWSDSCTENKPILPKDSMLAELLKECPQWIYKYHEHDTLLEPKIDEDLTETERRAAWTEYEAETKGKMNLAKLLEAQMNGGEDDDDDDSDDDNEAKIKKRLMLKLKYAEELKKLRASMMPVDSPGASMSASANLNGARSHKKEPKAKRKL